MGDILGIEHKILPLGRRVGDRELRLLGTCFAVARQKVATCFHVCGNDDSELYVPLRVQSIDGYQDPFPSEGYSAVKARMVAAEPSVDIAILQLDELEFTYTDDIGGTDDLKVGNPVIMFGFPHSTEGRMVLTRHDVQVGAKTWLRQRDPRAKGVVLNMLARPGQSGSPIYDGRSSSIKGVVVGAYANAGAGLMTVAGVDPVTLHQTTNAVSAEYIKDMI